MTIQGLITALITPFKNDKIDIESLSKLLEHQIKHGVKSAILAGSTGEGNSLDLQEYEELLKNAVNIGKDKLSIIAGSSASSTRFGLKQLEIAQKSVVNGFMSSVPPYVRATQEGIYRHFEELSKSSDIDLILYSVPKRTGSDFTDETIIALSHLPKIKAIKDASSDIDRCARLRLKVDPKFTFLAGNDESAISFNANGGKGLVSVASNIKPGICKQIQDYSQEGNFHLALDLQSSMMPLYEILSIESNPICVKYAAYLMHLCTSEIRLPLTLPSDINTSKIKEFLSKN